MRLRQNAKARRPCPFRRRILAWRGQFQVAGRENVRQALRFDIAVPQAGIAIPTFVDAASAGIASPVYVCFGNEHRANASFTPIRETVPAR